VIGLIIYIAISTVNKAAKEDHYVIGNDQIPSVKLALGEERKITGLNVSTAVGGATTKEIKYQVAGTQQGNEMLAYFTYLQEQDGFLSVSDIDFSGLTGKGVVARNSVDDGHQIQLKIQYDAAGYTIFLMKLPGKITQTPPVEAATPGDMNDPATAEDVVSPI